MSKPQKTLKTWSARQAVALLAVDNIKVSEFGYDVLRRNEAGLISYDQAKQEILARVKAKVMAAEVMKPKFR